MLHKWKLDLMRCLLAQMINNKTLPAGGNLYTCDMAKKKSSF